MFNRTFKLNSWLIVFLLLIGAKGVVGQSTVVNVSFEGLKKMKGDFLERFIETEVGAEADSLTLAKDVQALKNLNLFYEVSASFAEVEGGKQVVFHLKEVFTLLPIISFGVIQGNFWFQLGAVENNLAGRANVLGGFYRYYDRHSFLLYTQVPYLKGSPWGFSTTFSKYSTEEPIYFPSKDTTVVYDYDNISPELNIRYEFKFGHFVEMGSAYLYQRYRAQDPTLPPSGQDTVTTNKFLFKGRHRFEQLRFNFHQFDGFSNEIIAEVVYTPIYKSAFWKLVNETRYYKELGKNGNLALRLRFGLADNAETVFPPFVLDSYLNIRGIGNRVLRGSAELTSNIEYRHTFLNHKLGALQGVVFLDAGGVRGSGQKIGTLFSNRATYLGAGARIYIRKIYDLTLRFDYAFSLGDLKQHGAVLGVGQYF